jgi:hypothetical protein
MGMAVLLRLNPSPFCGQVGKIGGLWEVNLDKSVRRHM